MLTLADKTTAPFGDVSSTGWNRLGVLARRQVAGVRDGGRRRLSVNRGVFLQPFPATGAVYQAPKQLVDFHPVWA